MAAKELSPLRAVRVFSGAACGSMVGRFRNEDLESQTFSDDEFDLVFHLDVLEHLFNRFKALTETFRTLKPGGFCILTAPTYSDRVKSEQVAFVEADGNIRFIWSPEYHGSPQDPEAGVLVAWRYGYDLTLQIETDRIRCGGQALAIAQRCDHGADDRSLPAQ